MRLLHRAALSGLAVAVLFALGSSEARAAQVWYVDNSVAASGAGTSWGAAFKTLQEGLAAAASGDEIWVAAGTYLPAYDNDRNKSFGLVAGVAVYGGFAGTESARGERDWFANETVLSGDLNGDDLPPEGVGYPPMNNGENSYTVVTAATDATLDGFGVRSGCGSMAPGILADTVTGLVVENCSFDWHFWEVVVLCTSSTVTFSNCVFDMNRGCLAGAIHVDMSTVTLTNCVFSRNSADWGAGLRVSSGSTATATNCTFAANEADASFGVGGAVYNAGSADAVNCIMWGNTAYDESGDIYAAAGSTCTLTNTNTEQTIVYGATITDGGGNVSADPLFASPDMGNVRLRVGSPCIDTGTPTGAPATDIEGTPRPQGSEVDMGAYEAVGSGFDGVWRVKPGGTGDGSSWARAAGNPQDVLGVAPPGDEIWVAAGTYLPTDDGDRTVSFVLAPGVAMYGGFAGTESLRDDRNWATNETILSGDLAGDDDTSKALDDPLRNNGENAKTVVVGGDGAALDGFTLTAGAGADYGAGMFCEEVSVSIANCWFTDNRTPGFIGGALYCNCSGSAVSAVDCLFEGNQAVGSGAIHAQSVPLPGQLTVLRCIFRANAAVTIHGGALSTGWDTQTLVEDCIFDSNTAAGDGGAIVVFDGMASMVNCTVASNSAGGSGGGICASTGGAPASLANCIVWGNSSADEPEIWLLLGGQPFAVTYSCIKGGWTGTGNIGEDLVAHDPLFVDAAGGDLRLSAGSPCIDAADGDAASAADIEGLPRWNDPGMADIGVGGVTYADMGAHEFQGATPTGTVTGQVTLVNGPDPNLVTITAGRRTAAKAPAAGVIDYTISDVPVVTAEVTVATTQGSCTVTGSPAAIAWVGPAGTAADVTVTAPYIIVDDDGCTAGRGSFGAWLVPVALLLSVLAARRKRVALAGRRS
ncbi:MAG: choice-of-anchor Q domain-containing protein [Planctomycetota bacterium]|jgi:hypothetical protein